MILEIECVPSPLGTDADRYRHVDAAIAVVQASALHHEVHALGTVVEGPAAELWPLARRVHEACLASGADHVLTVCKMVEHASPELEPTMAALTGKHRP